VDKRQLALLDGALEKITKAGEAASPKRQRMWLEDAAVALERIIDTLK